MLFLFDYFDYYNKERKPIGKHPIKLLTIFNKSHAKSITLQTVFS